MPNIVLTRIDNRLVHGQVGNVWVKNTGSNLLLVADDEAANDPFQQSVMKMTADSSGVGIRFFSLAQTIEVIHKASDEQKILIVCKNPQSVRKLVEGGVPIKVLNVGNMHSAEGKRKNSSQFVYCDDQDIADITFIRDQGVEVFVQVLPNERRMDFNFNG